MQNKKLDQLIDQMENYLECWKQFNGFVNMGRAKKFNQEDDTHFLEVKSVIVQELELILSAVDVSSPTKEEIHDNIASFWRPKNALQAKGEQTYTYRLHWGPDVPKPTSLARFSRTGVGARGDDTRIFVLDLVGE